MIVVIVTEFESTEDTRVNARTANRFGDDDDDDDDDNHKNRNHNVVSYCLIPQFNFNFFLTYILFYIYLNYT